MCSLANLLGRGAAFVYAGVIATLLVGSPQAASAQPGQLSSLESYEPGQRGVLVVDWHGSDAAGGLLVSLPRDWHVDAMRVYTPETGLQSAASELRHGGSEAVVVNEIVQRDCTFLVEFTTGSSPGRSAARVAPLLRSGGALVEDRAAELTRPASTVRNAALPQSRDNHVGDFASGGIVSIARHRLPPVDESYAVSFWLRTTATDEVILSDWSGREEDAYDIEFLVAGDGSLAYYRGLPGRHESLKSSHPVADGRWHHVAISNSARSGRTRLFLDGVVLDSLVNAMPAGGPASQSVVVGRRATATSGDNALLGVVEQKRFSGYLDDVSFWSTDMTRQRVRRLMAGDTEGAVPTYNQDFESAPGTIGTEVQREDVSYRDPVSNLLAGLRGGAVELTWDSRDPLTVAYAIDRSYDGSSFDEVGRVPVERSFDGRFAFQDRFVDRDVVYYRVRQLLINGASRTSPTIKLGLADVMESGDAESRAMTVTNFPNPFREATSIRYLVPDAGFVDVSVWDLAGQPVLTLVSESQQAGEHEIPFAAGDLSAGTYFVRVQLGSSIKSHKLLLVK